MFDYLINKTNPENECTCILRRHITATGGSAFLPRKCLHLAEEALPKKPL